MVLGGQRIDNGDSGILGNLIHKGLSALRAPHDGVVHLVEHTDGVLHRFLDAHVRVGEIGEAETQIMAGGLEGAARARASPFKLGDDVFVHEASLIDAGALLSLQLVRQIEQVAKLLGREITQVDEVATKNRVSHDGVLSKECLAF